MDMNSNLGNSLAGLRNTIEVLKDTHWMLGLRQADLTILNNTRILRASTYSREQGKREKELSVEKVAYLKPTAQIFRHVPILGIWLRNKLADLEDKIAQWESSQSESDKLFRDCELELNAAIACKESILFEHPEVSELTYWQLQEKYSEEAFIEKNYAYIEPRLSAIQHGIPESVCVALSEVPRETRHKLLEKIRAFHEQNSVGNIDAAVVNAIASLPPERQEFFLGLLASEAAINQEAGLGFSDTNPIAKAAVAL